jgi:hypothetical protein
MFFKKIFMDDAGSLSYLIGCTSAGTACVVNPKRDVQEYLATALQNGMTITHVFDTRRYSNQIACNMELKLRTNAGIYYVNTFDQTNHHICHEGDLFKFGNAIINIIDCPSIDPFGNAILVIDESDVKAPWAILGSNSLFIGDIAKPGMADEVLQQTLTHYLDCNIPLDRNHSDNEPSYKYLREAECIHEFAAYSM